MFHIIIFLGPPVGAQYPCNVPPMSYKRDGTYAAGGVRSRAHLETREDKKAQLNSLEDIHLDPGFLKLLAIQLTME